MPLRREPSGAVSIEIGELFTEDDIIKANEIKRRYPLSYLGRWRDEIITPAMPRINQVTEQENDPQFMTYALSWIISILEKGEQEQ